MVSREDIRRLAFVEHGPSSLQLVQDGPLAGLSFAAKDLIDIAGTKSAWGNPDRLRDARPAVATAPAALVPLMAGARLIGGVRGVRVRDELQAARQHGRTEPGGRPASAA